MLSDSIARRGSAAQGLDLRSLLAGSIIAWGLISADVSLAAEEPGYAGPILDDEFFLVLGGFFPSIDPSVQVDSSSGTPGSSLDFEDPLGLESSAVCP